MEGVDAELGFELPVDGALGNRRAEPEEVARVICFLLSEEASYVSGSVWRVDGGMLC